MKLAAAVYPEQNARLDPLARRPRGCAARKGAAPAVVAEQSAIDTCGGYDSSKFGPLPTDLPGSPTCSHLAKHVAPGAPFTGDFGKLSDRSAYGDKRCCS
jgi:hypothetical protein